MSNRPPLLRVARQSGLYALGNMAVKLSGLLLAPYYLNASFLPLADYGYLALLLLTAQVCIHTAGLGLSTGLLKFMTDAELADDQGALPFTALASSVVTAAIAVGLLALNGGLLAEWVLDDAERSSIIFWLACYVGAKVVIAVPMMMMRIQERAGLFSTALGFEMLVLIGCVHYFLGIQGAGLIGVLKAYACSAGVSLVLLAGGMLTRVSWRFSPHLIRPLVKFGAPLVLAGLSSIVLNAGDRFVLKEIQEATAVGMYEWAGRLSGVLNMLLVQSFQLAFTVIGLKTLGEGDRSLHRNAFRHYAVWGSWAVLGVSVFAYDVTELLQNFGADPHYLTGIPLVLPLSIGFLIYGIYVVINNVLYATWRTREVGINVVVAAAVNIGLNILLIPYLGAWGAALTTVLSYSLLAYLGLRIAEREMPMVYPWGTFFGALGLVAVLYVPAYLAQPLDPLWRWPLHISIVLTYVPLAFFFRLYSKADIERARLAWQSWRRKGTSGGDEAV